MNIRKVLCRVEYELLGKYLPVSHNIGGKIASRIRYQIVRGYISSCGSDVNFEHGADISSTLKIGNHSGVGVNAHVPEHVTIGDKVMMGPYCLIYTRNHKHQITPEVPFRKQGYEEFKPVTIGNNVWIGARVIILPGVTIADNTVVAAGAVVTKSFPAGSIIGGNPVRAIKSNS